jgi:hypothetical protein
MKYLSLILLSSLGGCGPGPVTPAPYEPPVVPNCTFISGNADLSTWSCVFRETTTCDVEMSGETVLGISNCKEIK